jgi:hypothetical protein
MSLVICAGEAKTNIKAELVDHEASEIKFYTFWFEGPLNEKVVLRKS